MSDKSEKETKEIKETTTTVTTTTSSSTTKSHSSHHHHKDKKDTVNNVVHVCIYQPQFTFNNWQFSSTIIIRLSIIIIFIIIYDNSHLYMTTLHVYFHKFALGNLFLLENMCLSFLKGIISVS